MPTLFHKNLTRKETFHHADKMDGESSPANIRHSGAGSEIQRQRWPPPSEKEWLLHRRQLSPQLCCTALSLLGLQKCREVKEGAPAMTRATQIQTQGCARGMPFLSNTSLIRDHLEMLVSQFSLWHRAGQHLVLSIFGKVLWVLSAIFLSVAVGESVCLQMTKSICEQKA